MANRVEIHPDDKSRAERNFVGDDMQKALHNRILDKIEEARLQLEKSNQLEFGAHQAQVKAWRGFLCLIHEHDTPSDRKFYGIEN